MIAVWGEDYDFRSNKTSPCPCCPECDEPVWKIKGKYRCLCCDKVVDVADQGMKEWFAVRERKHEGNQL